MSYQLVPVVATVLCCHGNRNLKINVFLLPRSLSQRWSKQQMDFVEVSILDLNKTIYADIFQKHFTQKCILLSHCMLASSLIQHFFLSVRWKKWFAISYTLFYAIYSVYSCGHLVTFYILTRIQKDGGVDNGWLIKYMFVFC